MMVTEPVLVLKCMDSPLEVLGGLNIMMGLAGGSGLTWGLTGLTGLVGFVGMVARC